jgi:hypothetical protein
MSNGSRTSATATTGATGWTSTATAPGPSRRSTHSADLGGRGQRGMSLSVVSLGPGRIIGSA